VRKNQNGFMPGPTVAVDGTMFMSGWSRYNGMGGWTANAAPGVNSNRQFTAYDSNNIWYSADGATNFYGGPTWVDRDKRAGPQPLVNFTYAPHTDQSDAWWGTDAQNNVCRSRQKD